MNMKVLIVSHNPITTYQNMGKTLLSLFFSFRIEDLCQFYIYPSVPNIDTCKSYYRITDKDILKSYFIFKVKGKEIKADIQYRSQEFENENDVKIYRNKKNRLPGRMLLRDAMWRYAHWFNKGLKIWMEREKPTCIFVAPGTAKFIYRIAEKLAKKYNLPIVSYICDDYYFVKDQKNFLKKIQVKSLQRQIYGLILRSTAVIVISKEMERQYSKHFGDKFYTLMTGSNYQISNEIKSKENIKEITYLGNLDCNRYRALIDIGQTLKKINEKTGSNYILKIYSHETNSEILSDLSKINTIKFCGFITGEEFNKVFFSADILLHVEAFDEESIDRVKYSVSTKIADSLASGICLIAYGPEEVASMRHLIENECAYCITSESALVEGLTEILNNKQKRDILAKKGLEVAKEWHDSQKNSQNFYKLLSKQ